MSSKGAALHMLQFGSKLFISKVVGKFVKSQQICGPLGPKFDGFCAYNTIKMKSGMFSLWKVHIDFLLELFQNSWKSHIVKAHILQPLHHKSLTAKTVQETCIVGV